MPIAKNFNTSAIERARAELRVFQSNIMVQTEDGSELRAVFEGPRFVDYLYGDPIENVQDFWIEPRFPDCPGIQPG